MLVGTIFFQRCLLVILVAYDQLWLTHLQSGMLVGTIFSQRCPVLVAYDQLEWQRSYFYHVHSCAFILTTTMQLDL
jgi:hypothetical protein